ASAGPNVRSCGFLQTGPGRGCGGRIGGAHGPLGDAVRAQGLTVAAVQLPTRCRSIASNSAGRVGVSDFSAQGILAYERRSRRPKGANTVVRCPFLPATFGEVILDRMTDVTRILSAIEQGDPHAAEQLLPLVYEELRQLAAQKLAQEKA